MKIKAVLFDLDGTLLPMDQDLFVKTYIGGLIKTLAPRGYAPEDVGLAIKKSTEAMFKNDGTKTNEQVFWDNFTDVLGDSVRDEEVALDEFYATDFQKLKSYCGYASESLEIVKMLKRSSIRTVLATNPLFPRVATQSRMNWAGLSTDDFEFYTTYEDNRYCKPNPKYYESILERLGLSGEECLMVGNDALEDMIAEKVGMNLFLLTDNLINTNNLDLTKYKKGGFSDLKNYLEEIINEEH